MPKIIFITQQINNASLSQDFDGFQVNEEYVVGFDYCYGEDYYYYYYYYYYWGVVGEAVTGEDDGDYICVDQEEEDYYYVDEFYVIIGVECVGVFIVYQSDFYEEGDEVVLSECDYSDSVFDGGAVFVCCFFSDLGTYENEFEDDYVCLDYYYYCYAGDEYSFYDYEALYAE
ncbi:MAG: hypothetical protein EZS28_016150 [Streblomastix strix]|uniref:Uncharacterized protein n=1 Tax=Streblomastix strix TaxID=222440 RepID=A0A5J4W056_9EUKA|nr:MAG: hypothetical protein EZS28_016150 [Streblomastix strix]